MQLQLQRGTNNGIVLTCLTSPITGSINMGVSKANDRDLDRRDNRSHASQSDGLEQESPRLSCHIPENPCAIPNPHLRELLPR